MVADDRAEVKRINHGLLNQFKRLRVLYWPPKSTLRSQLNLASDGVVNHYFGTVLNTTRAREKIDRLEPRA